MQRIVGWPLKNPTKTIIANSFEGKVVEVAFAPEADEALAIAA